MKKVLVTGCLGQIGSELVLRLREDLGNENVVATDIRMPEKLEDGELFEILDVMDYEKMRALVEKYQVDTLIHLAALLSAVAEAKPKFAWDLNMVGLVNALEVAREFKLKFFTPSSIGAFGSNTPKDETPQDTLQRPTTMYGVTKVAGELLCDYYYTKYGVDTRGVRFPGLISYKTLPGGGTTDYAVDIYYSAIKEGKYTCFIDRGTAMDMMYMPDAIEAIVQLMNADPKNLVHRNAFNISAMSFEPEEIKASIKKVFPDFEMDYAVDPVRQSIADSWPNSLDISCAQKEWGFQPRYDLDKMTQDMLSKLQEKLTATV
ncbi:L-threonine 3-dehydrogenase [Enterococcus hirae]|uniref:L-threonine 3-dehydrogenase n=1 Tax=Enterococcus hirae TaxID=1354 RepID=UPI0010ACE746|nr:L-threonine 3-dehydrogenase [Enterococcus hirae]EMF0069161.1 L-threonine 3-dehydrogenase [Enterococcus hirae]EMF0227360.1 L-threonine 3-dehydrogenase [Enterococcus hirae]EMF0603494.1 L-threonine 3-dehydrogenase [Enterococcus hirae]TJY31443.1 L-threonine 3-dehydrogenase [Enterococcus hirae]